MKVNFHTGNPIYPALPPALQKVIDVYQGAYYAPNPTLMLVTLATYAASLQFNDPLWIMIVGGSSTGKTATMDCLKLLKVFSCSTVTVASLLSGTGSKERDMKSTGGILWEIGVSGMIAMKDFTTILSMGRDPMREVLAALREIYDGKWVRALGVDGGKRLEWEGKVNILAACTTAIDEHSHIMASMGERFLHYRLPRLDAEEQEEMATIAMRNSELTHEQRPFLAEEVERFFAEWRPGDRAVYSEETVRAAIRGWATLTARCRSAVTRHGITREIEMVHAPEDPARLAGQLHRLEASLCSIGVPPRWRFMIVRQIARDCIPPIRRSIVHRLVGCDEPLELKGLAIATEYPNTTTRRAAQELMAHGIVRNIGNVIDTEEGPDLKKVAAAKGSSELNAEAKGRWIICDEWRERWNRFPKCPTPSRSTE
jgi:hypothetical protein